MPSALVVPLLVLVERVNLHWPLCVSQHVARCQGKGPAGVARKGVQGSLEPMLKDAQEQRAPSLTAATGCTGADQPLMSHSPPWRQTCRWCHFNGRKWRGTKEHLDKGKRGEGKSWFKTQHSKNKDYGFWSYHFIANRWGTSGNSIRFHFLGLQNQCVQWPQPQNWKMLVL